MKYRTRTIYTPEQKAQMWDRWEKGDSLHAIARLFDRGHSSVFGQLSPTGGIRPPARKRPKRVLSISEREEISRGLVNGLSLRTIATPVSLYNPPGSSRETPFPYPQWYGAIRVKDPLSRWHHSCDI